MSHKALKIITDETGILCLYAFLILLPLTYALQVISGRPEVAILTYAFLIVSYIQLFRQRHQSQRLLPFTRSLVDFLPLGFSFLLIHHVVSAGDALLAGDFQMAVRGMLLFTLPLLLFWLVQELRSVELKMILVLLSILGGLVSCELLYENFSARILESPTVFQLFNRDYILARNGVELKQFWITSQRPPGLLEHVHAVTYFAAFAALANAVLFCLEGRWRWLLGMCVCAAALLAHGVRLPVVAAMITFALLTAVVYKREHRKDIRKRGIWIFLALVALVLIQLFVDPLGTSKIYYWPVFLSGDFQIEDATTSQYVVNESTRLINISAWGDLLTGQQTNLLVAAFGHGIVGSLNGIEGTSDDLFLLSILSQYGLLGALIFFGIWLLAIYCAILGLMRVSTVDDDERAALYFATGVFIILAVSMLHSGVLQRKVIYPYFPLVAGIVWRYVRLDKYKAKSCPAGGDKLPRVSETRRTI